MEKDGGGQAGSLGRGQGGRQQAVHHDCLRLHLLDRPARVVGGIGSEEETKEGIELGLG
jgi:hypothetical protein